MPHLIALKEHLLEEKSKFLEKLRQEEEIRDSAPTAMESHSDTTRHRYEESIRNLKNKIHELEVCLQDLPESVQSDLAVSLWDSVIVDLDGQKQEFILVPEGIGGRKLQNGATLLSVKSPLGELVVNKKLNQSFSFGQKQVTIVST